MRLCGEQKRRGLAQFLEVTLDAGKQDRCRDVTHGLREVIVLGDVHALADNGERPCQRMIKAVEQDFHCPQASAFGQQNESGCDLFGVAL